jgi:hypothetical protein
VLAGKAQAVDRRALAGLVDGAIGPDGDRGQEV